MEDILLVLFGILFLVAGVTLMVKNKFYKHKATDLAFLKGLNNFLSSIMMIMVGIAALIAELKKIIHI